MEKYWTPDRPMDELTVGERRNLSDLIKTRIERNRLSYVWLIGRLIDEGVRVSKSDMSSIVNGTRFGAKADEVLRKSADILLDYERRMAGDVT